MQYILPYIEHTIQGEVINQRAKDGYINATAMCKAAGKQWAHYYETKQTKSFIVQLSSDIDIPISEVIQILKGGTPTLQGTWVHPQVAINLATWLSAKFAVMVSKWVMDWMSGGIAQPQQLPFHLRRYLANSSNVPAGHFSILNEMTLSLIAPLEQEGYHLPEHLWPDISEGKLFARYMREIIGVDTDEVPAYLHTFEDGRASVWPKAYPNEFLHIFRSHFMEVWLPKKALAYFEDKDPTAIPYLKKVLTLPSHNPPPKLPPPTKKKAA